MGTVPKLYLVINYEGFPKYMGTFPDRKHYFAAAGENRDIGSLWKRAFFIGRLLVFTDP